MVKLTLILVPAVPVRTHREARCGNLQERAIHPHLRHELAPQHPNSSTG